MASTYASVSQPTITAVVSWLNANQPKSYTVFYDSLWADPLWVVANTGNGNPFVILYTT